MTKKLIEVSNLSTRFGQQIVHRDLTFDVYEHEILGIVGGSGSGKSVLLRMLIGLDKPQHGKISYTSPKLERGILFQSGALLSSLTVLDNVALPLLQIGKVSKELAQELAFMKLAHVGIDTNDAYKFPSQLSGGMIKRVGLARAIAMDPAALFLDEPTAGLDPVIAAEIDTLIRELQSQLKMTVILVTHDLDTIAHVCNRIAVLVDHQIITGKIEEVVANQHPWIQSYFLGDRGKHLFGKTHGE